MLLSLSVTVQDDTRLIIVDDDNSSSNSNGITTMGHKNRKVEDGANDFGMILRKRPTTSVVTPTGTITNVTNYLYTTSTSTISSTKTVQYENDHDDKQLNHEKYTNHDDDEQSVSTGTGNYYQNDLDILDWSDITLGRRIGFGSFSNVFEVKSIKEDDDNNDNNNNDTNNKISKNKKAAMQKKQFVLKVLRPHLLDEPKLFRQCRDGLIHEGKVLSTLIQTQQQQQESTDDDDDDEKNVNNNNNNNIISIRGWSKSCCDSSSSSHHNNIDLLIKQRHDDYFLVMERIEATLGDKLHSWREYNKLNQYKKKQRQQQYYHYHHRQQVSSVPTLLNRCQMMIELSNAIGYLHQHKIIHRDIKPDNIGFDNHGTLKLFDFDCSRILPSSTTFPTGVNDNDDDTTFHLTQRIGTRRYMSPECALGKPYNCKSDVYSFAIVCYELFTLLRKPCYDDDDNDDDDNIMIQEVRDGNDVSTFKFGSNSTTVQEILETFWNQCWNDNINHRPTISKVKQILQDIVIPSISSIMMMMDMKKEEEKTTIPSSSSSMGAATTKTTTTTKRTEKLGTIQRVFCRRLSQQIQQQQREESVVDDDENDVPVATTIEGTSTFSNDDTVVVSSTSDDTSTIIARDNDGNDNNNNQKKKEKAKKNNDDKMNSNHLSSSTTIHRRFSYKRLSNRRRVGTTSIIADPSTTATMTTTL